MYWAVRSCWEKKEENKKFNKPALLGANIIQILFSHLDHRKYLLLFCSTGLSLFHILQQACQNSNWFLWKFYVLFLKLVILYQIFERKWNWQNVVTQIFLSEIISTTENGGGDTHFARFFISLILKVSIMVLEGHFGAIWAKLERVYLRKIDFCIYPILPQNSLFWSKGPNFGPKS